MFLKYIKWTLMIFVFAFTFCFGSDVYAEWEVGVKAGMDSNIDRSVEGGQSDSFLTGYFAFIREPGIESVVDWNLDVIIEGSAYAKSTGLNYGMASIAPGIVFNLSPVWSVNLSPFIQGKAVDDSEQSAFAYGGKVNVKQQWSEKYYTGEYFIYTDSHANEDVYSYKENALGAIFGVNWTQSLFTELGYEFSYGDSFRAVPSGTVISIPVGNGPHRRFSNTFQEDIISEFVNRHVIGVKAGFAFTESIFSVINYTYTSASGDSGTSESHAGFAGIGYRF